MLYPCFQLHTNQLQRKLLEHIIVIIIIMMKQLESNNILIDCQDSFCQRWLCETQLVTLLKHMSINTDVIAMDLRKAFNTVPHRRLLKKSIEWYS